MKTLKNIVHPCMGVSHSLAEAIIQATDAANAWLMVHQWRDTRGQSAYTLAPLCHFDGTNYTYVIHLIGPDETTP